jgi:hypothetical protein
MGSAKLASLILELHPLKENLFVTRFWLPVG